MSIEFRRKTDGNYLVVSPEEIRAEDFEIRIFETCRIPGLLQCGKEILNGRCSYLYNISSMISLETYTQTGGITRDNIRTILINILNAVLSAREYMLSEDHILFSPSYIFISPYDLKTALCFDPASDEPFRISFSALMEYMTEHIYRYDREGAMLVFRVLKAVSRGNLSVIDLKEMLYEESPGESNDGCSLESEDDSCDYTEESPEKDEESPENIVAGSGTNAKKILKTALLLFAASATFVIIVVAARYGTVPVSSEILAGACTGLLAIFVFIRLIIKKKRSRIPPVKDGSVPKCGHAALQESVVGDDMALLYKEEESSTMLISDTPPGHALLRPLDSAYPSRPLGAKPVLIGKHRELCDLVIKSPVISRMHARITQDKGEFRIQDLNSKNGTSVNGRMLSGSEKAKLSDGDIIRFADVSYVFDFNAERT